MASVPFAQRTSQWRGCLGDWSLEAASEQSIVAQPCYARGESVGGPAPPQLLNVAEEPGVSVEGRQFLEEQRQLAPLAEPTRWQVFNANVSTDETGRGRFTDPRQTWVAVCGVTDEGEEVRNQVRHHTEFFAHTLRI